MGGEEHLQELMVALVRAFGLHRPDQTPCGQPVSVSEAHALMELARAEPLSQGELVGRLQLEKSTVSRLVSRLEQRRWVERERSPEDGRAVLLRLTGEGRLMSDRLGVARADKFALVFAGIPTTERKSVLHALEVLVGAMNKSIALLAMTAFLLTGCAGQRATAAGETAGITPAAPYAGLQDRPIRALAPERVEDLLVGRGAGYALAAELNHYPGPTHTLELAKDLHLTPDQEREVRDILAAMQQEAQMLGRQLVDLEAELDRAFRTAEITPAELAQLTGEISATEGRLRDTHLAAHLKTKAILTRDQVARYDQLRGYTSDVPPTGGDESIGAAHGSKHGGH